MQKKQTVRISLPPKPAGGPSIKIPSPSAPVGSAQTAAPAAPAAAAPVAAAPAKPAAPAAPAAAPARPAPVTQAVRQTATISMLDVGLAFATVVVVITVAVMIFLEAPKIS